MFDAVRDLMATRGMQLSMDSVAQQAGCSKQTLYSRYGSKQELLRRCCSGTCAGPRPGCVHWKAMTCAAACCSSPSTTDHFNEPHVVQTRRLIAGEAARFPDEARSCIGMVRGTDLSPC